ncbi:MAG: hypothetical protein KAH57_00730 [Thermoplasmata archaeon]|nr:hypothetical protein [Thermoplasmata archaeon]
MIVSSDLLIPIINREIREGRTQFEIFEGWRKDDPLFRGEYENGVVLVDSITKRGYRSLMPNEREIPDFQELIQKVLQASGVIDPGQLSGYQERFKEIVQDEEPFRRNTRFYYDTNSFMNNYFFLFREMIPDFTKNASHNTSLGVVAEMEDIVDRKLKGQYFPDHFKKTYGNDDEIFYNQPNLFGRFARLAYPEIEYLKDKLRANILTDDGVGDRNILSAFVHDSSKYNLEGVVVTNDGVMGERAEKRMGSWLVRFELDRIKALKTKLEYFIEAIYRASVIYGRVAINDDIVVSGLWHGKKIEDWNDRCINIERCNECDVKRIHNILKEIPDDFYGKGYYS